MSQERRDMGERRGVEGQDHCKVIDLITPSPSDCSSWQRGLWSVTILYFFYIPNNYLYYALLISSHYCHANYYFLRACGVQTGGRGDGDREREKERGGRRTEKNVIASVMKSFGRVDMKTTVSGRHRAPASVIIIYPPDFMSFCDWDPLLLHRSATYCSEKMTIIHRHHPRYSLKY